MKERVNRLGMWASEETLAVTQLLSSWKVENRFMKFDFFQINKRSNLLVVCGAEVELLGSHETATK